MGWSLPQDCGNKARTLTAVLYRAPAMALNIHTIVQDGDAFMRNRARCSSPRAARGQADPTAGTQYPVPGQSGRRVVG
jgi:hypothetical protein